MWQKLKRKVNLYHCSNIIGATTWIIAITGITMFSEYFNYPERIWYLALGIQGYASLTPAVAYLVQFFDENPAVRTFYVYVYAIMMIGGALAGLITILIAILQGGDVE